MIRAVDPRADAEAVADIYNYYILHSFSTFDTEPIDCDCMFARLNSIASRWPCLVAVDDASSCVTGFAYVHPWKEKAAYSATLETTVYLHPAHTGKGLGRALMERLIAECGRRSDISSLIACITGGNTASERLHASLGFTKVSHFVSVGYKHGRHLDVADWQLMVNTTENHR